MSTYGLLEKKILKSDWDEVPCDDAITQWRKSWETNCLKEPIPENESDFLSPKKKKTLCPS